MNCRNLKELKLLSLAMHPNTPNAEALAAVRKLGKMTSKRGGVRDLVCMNDEEFSLSANKQLTSTLSLRKMDQQNDFSHNVMNVRS